MKNIKTKVGPATKRLAKTDAPEAARVEVDGHAGVDPDEEVAHLLDHEDPVGPHGVGPLDAQPGASLPDDRCQMPDVRCQMTDDRCQMTDDRCQMPDAR